MTGAVGLRPILGEFVVSDTPQAEAAPQRCCFSGTAARPPRPQERINRPRAHQRRRVREGFSSSATGTVLSPRAGPSNTVKRHPPRQTSTRLGAEAGGYQVVTRSSRAGICTSPPLAHPFIQVTGREDTFGVLPIETMVVHVLIVAELHRWLCSLYPL
jgi:hypothetical protein